MEIRLEEQRVDRINEPLLVISLGGTGADALLHIKDKFLQHFNMPVLNGQELDTPARTAFLAVDTDSTVLTQKQWGTTKLTAKEFFDISLPGISGLLNPALSRGLLQPYELEWLDQDLQSPTVANGAGCVRQLGRFMLCRKADSLAMVLETIILRLMAVLPSEQGGESITVVITAGLAGGTGSGTFLDMANLIRYVMAKQFRGIRLSLLGCFFLPDVTLSHFPYNPPISRLLQANGFAALKELDFWMNYDRHHYAYTHQYSQTVSVKWDQPFNNVVLISSSTEDGAPIANAYEVTMNAVSETLMHFMADERNYSTDGFTFQSHWVNIQGAMANVERRYPVNYCYTAMGAASLEGPRNDLILHETTRIFDRLQARQHGDSLLGTHFPDAFHRAVISEFEDPSFVFSQSMPLPSKLSTEPECNYADVWRLEAGAALHRDPYIAYLQSAHIGAVLYANEYQERAWRRFRNEAIVVISNPQQGSFRFEEYLCDPRKGFVFKLEQWKQYWQARKNGLAAHVDEPRLHIDQTLYPAMMRTSAIERIISNRRVKEYVSATQQLYIASRDQILAEQMLVVFEQLSERVRRYVTPCLAAVNMMVLQTRTLLHEEENRRRNDPDGLMTHILPYDDVCRHLDTAFADLESNEADITQRALAQMAETSFAMHNNGSIPADVGYEARQQELFSQTADRVTDYIDIIKSITVDDSWEFVMPETSENERVAFVATQLLPKLHNRARVMYPQNPIMRSLTNGFIKQSYVSVPCNANISKQGLERYCESRGAVTLKESRITDRLYWLKTYNYMPLCYYAGLTALEADYEACLSNPSIHGLHLIYNTGNGHNRESIRNTWKVMPSPVPHLLLGQTPSPRQEAQLQCLQRIMNKAFALGVTKLSDVTPDGVDVFLIRDENGVPLDGETLRALFGRIIEDPQTTGRQKYEALHKLTQELIPQRLIYGDFTNEFAMALNLKIRADDSSEAACLEAKSNLVKVRQYIAGYMIALQPELQEQLERQLLLQEELRKAMIHAAEETTE